MRTKPTSIIRLLAASVLLTFGATLVCAAAASTSHQGKQAPAQKVPEAERKAAQKIDDAKDPATKIQAAREFIQAYPKSSLRPAVATAWAIAIADVQDMAQRITFAEAFLNTFTEASETAMVYPSLIGAYVYSNRAEDAFKTAPKLLQTTPNEAYVLYLLTLAGANEAQRGNKKFLQQSEQYGQKAIELFEANQRPTSVSVEEWGKSRTYWLSQLYQSVAMLALTNNKNSEAQASLQKAATLTPNEPMIYYLLSGTKNDEYQLLVGEFRKAPAGAAQDQARKKAEAKLDEVIDLYARVVALTEGKAQFKPMRDQTLQDLTSYYKFRHNNSTTGMQELINKYKQPPTP